MPIIEICLLNFSFVVAGEFGALAPPETKTLIYARYLYESERCHEGLPLAHLALEILQDETSLTYAQGIDILGLLWLDTNHPRKALECFHTCWDIRKKTLPRNDPFTAVALNHVSLAYTELRDFPQAAGYQQQAINIRLEIDSPLIGNSYSNMSSILLGMGKPDEAEQMLMRCPSLKDMNDESFLRTDNPRFSRYAFMYLSQILHYLIIC